MSSASALGFTCSLRIGVMSIVDLLGNAIEVRSPCQSDATQLPSRRRRKEVPVRQAGVRARSGAGSAAQDHLVAHELPVVFAERALVRLVTGIRKIGGGGPLPGIAEELIAAARPRMKVGRLEKILAVDLRSGAPCGNLPFEFGRQACTGPSCIGVGLVVADVDEGSSQLLEHVAEPRDRIMAPLAVVFLPVQRRAPSVLS